MRSVGAAHKDIEAPRRFEKSVFPWRFSRIANLIPSHSSLATSPQSLISLFLRSCRRACFVAYTLVMVFVFHFWMGRIHHGRALFFFSGMGSRRGHFAGLFFFIPAKGLHNLRAVHLCPVSVRRGVIDEEGGSGAHHGDDRECDADDDLFHFPSPPFSSLEKEPCRALLPSRPMRKTASAEETPATPMESFVMR